MKKGTKIALYTVGFVIISGGIIYFIMGNRKKQILATIQNSPNQEPNAKSKVVSAKTKTAAVTSGSATVDTSTDFPLEQGDTDSDSVRTLQRILGVTVDGDFGPKTLAALKAFTGGQTTVPNQAALDQLSAKKAAAQDQATASARAQQLLEKWNSGDSKQFNILVTADATWYGFDEDFSGLIVYDDNNITQPKGIVLNNNDYNIYGTTKGGNLEIEILNGDLADTYIVNPSTVSLVNA
ncbi:MAG TPA: putative peptidoglycan-binding domain-containing protein [Puia sp.]|nr:putative peptidoglycan-binding domain-containing protein [Puia sp.]